MLRSLIELLPSASWAIDSEPIGARGIIAKSTVNSSRLKKKKYIYILTVSFVKKSKRLSFDFRVKGAKKKIGLNE